MLNKQLTSKILRVATATLAFSLIQLPAGTIFMTTVAMASSGGGGGGGGGTDRGEGSGTSSRSNFSGGNTAKARCRSQAYKKKDAVAFCSKKLGKAVICRGKPRRWICS